MRLYIVKGEDIADLVALLNSVNEKWRSLPTEAIFLSCLSLPRLEPIFQPTQVGLHLMKILLILGIVQELFLILACPYLGFLIFGERRVKEPLRTVWLCPEQRLITDILPHCIFEFRAIIEHAGLRDEQIMVIKSPIIELTILTVGH